MIPNDNEILYTAITEYRGWGVKWAIKTMSFL